MMNKNIDTEILDRNIEAILGNLLRIGVIIAGSVVLFGAVLFLIKHGFETPSYHTFKPDNFNFSNFHDLYTGIITFQSVSIIEFGILLLIATPVLRVFFSVFAFAYEKDYMYVLFTIIVLIVLVFSFLL